MVRTGRLAALGLVLTMAPARPSIASVMDRPSIVVYVDNRAGVPRHELLRAHVELGEVFQAAGVDIVWSEGGLTESLTATRHTIPRTHVIVMLVGSSVGRMRNATACPLGFAIPDRSMAYVLYNRIVAESRSQAVDLDVMLGRVIAHEVGHVLMPLGKHARYGIMRATLDVAFRNPNRFTDDEARTMRADLIARSRSQ